VRIARLLAGLLLGGMLVGIAWFAGWITPPESLARRVALWATLYPASTAGGVIEPIPCEPLPRVRFYVVCTEECEGVWRIAAVKGLRTIQLANLARTPPESVPVTRRRINTIVRGERVLVTDDQARRMVEFYLRLEGLAPARLLDEADRGAVEETRTEGEEALQALAARIAEGDPLERIPIERDGGGLRSTLLYWDTARRGWPVVEMSFRMGGFGDVLDVRVRQLSSSEDEEEAAPVETAPDSSGGASGQR